MTSRIILIGDLHGAIDELHALLAKLAPGPDDRVISVGDFLDKGPDGPACVTLFRERGYEAVLGNHEEWHLRFRRHELKRKTEPGYTNPMTFSNRSPGTTDPATISEQDWAYLAALPLYLRPRPGMVVVHGGIRPGRTPETHDKGELLRLRWVDANGKHVPVDYDKLDEPLKPGVVHWTDRYTGQEDVVYGHEAHTLSRPSVIKTPKGARCFGIDTGVVHGGHLTALVLFEDGSHTFEQVRARKNYRPPHTPIPWD